MGNYFAEFDTTPTNAVADLKTRILNSSDWANISGGTGNVLQATTTQGAQLNIDLADAAATSRQLQVGIYRTYSAGSGTDKLVRYLCWHPTVTGATSDTVHMTVSAGKDHLFITAEGPRPGETNAEDGSSGTDKQCLCLGAVLPYFAGDTTPCVVSVANPTATSKQTSVLAYVSRNQANTTSWVVAKLATLTIPSVNGGQSWFSAQRTCTGDTNTYLWPYVVIEDAAGIRGRLSKVFFAGSQAQGATPGTGVTDYPPPIYQRVTYNSENYILIAAHKGSNSGGGFEGSAFGTGSNNSAATAWISPVVAVPTA